MIKEEFTRLKDKLKDQHSQEIRDLDMSFALSNNPYKEGDIITSHLVSIKIEKILLQEGYGGHLPECIYYGPLVKKDGTPFKNGKTDHIYQSNIIKK